MKTIHKDLLAIKNIIYDPCEFKCSQPVIELESTEYGACHFELNTYSVLFRAAKITPVKIGQFVTLWKRDKNGLIQPYDTSDSFDLVVISTRKDNYFGQFIFTKSVLCEKGILSVNGKGGKLGIRVYPSWDVTTNRQAQKTQEWQMNYFLETSVNSAIDFSRARMLYATSN